MTPAVRADLVRADFVRALDSALLHFIWQGAVVALLLWIVLAILRKRSANARYMASCLALGLLTLLPIATASLAYTSPARFGPLPTREVLVLASNPVASPIPLEVSHPQIDWLALAQQWMLPVWSFGVLLLSIRLLWGCARVSGFKRNGDPVEPVIRAAVERLAERMHVTRPIRVLVSALADGPSVVGWIRPVLLLPAATILGLSLDQLEAVLAHELAHIRRYDYLVNLVQMLIETLFFYHPAVWWISSRIRHERELCCDDIAVRSCGDAVCYARALATLERMRIGSGSLVLSAAALGPKGGSLKFRIERLLVATGTTTQVQGSSRLPGILAICLGLACFATNINPAKAQRTPLAPAPMPPPAPVLRPAQTLRKRLVLAQVQVADAPGVRVDFGTSQALQRAPVFYPADARARGVEGTVFLQVNIDQNGEVLDASVLNGPLELRKAALQSVLDWRFKPDAASSTRQVFITFDRSTTPAPAALEAYYKRLVLSNISREVSKYVAQGPFDLRYPIGNPIGADELQQRRRDVQIQIEKILAQQKEASQIGAGHLQGYIDDARRGLTQLEGRSLDPSALAGRTLEDISINGVSEDQHRTLLSRLPIQIHGVLTVDSIAAALRAAHEFDPKALVGFGVTQDGQAEFGVLVPLPSR